ncbi:hypothetical protein RBSH_04067 [Rhodopirellula baltica SH28]|uniref:Uncharacterized protein n=1 Tax=Rhodopirellula baltica SH28 TaxID=993517 RepID=K5CB72_RHOBT|nr:hypothetical protein RBSH_04067 [Rhodopirellula baltica SH28]
MDSGSLSAVTNRNKTAMTAALYHRHLHPDFPGDQWSIVTFILSR